MYTYIEKYFRKHAYGTVYRLFSIVRAILTFNQDKVYCRCAAPLYAQAAIFKCVRNVKDETGCRILDNTRGAYRTTTERHK